MANVIKLKYGSGVPGNNQLVTGEIGLDLTNKVIYSCDADNNIVEMGRNMGEGGTIGWDQIDPDTIPPSLEIIINGEIPEYITLDALIAQVKTNEDDIAALQGWESLARAEIIKLQGDVSANRTDIDTNKGDIKTLSDKQGEQGLLISGNTDAIAELDGRVVANKGEIDALKTALEGELTGLVLGGEYNAASNVVENPTPEGREAGLVHNQPLPKAEATKGVYVIVTTEGPLDGTGIAPKPDPVEGGERNDEDMAFPGDWLVSDGIHGWVLFQFHTDATQWGMIGGSITAQTDLQDALDEKYDKDSEIVCGNYSS